MPFDWKDYLDLARYLQGAASGGFTPEAGMRSAVSRAYYAAFCHSRNYAHTNQGFQPHADVGDHANLRNHFRSRNRQIATWLDQLRQWRNQCDYNNSISNLNSMTTSALQIAENVVRRLP